jgi:hypothetical protein
MSTTTHDISDSSDSSTESVTESVTEINTYLRPIKYNVHTSLQSRPKESLIDNSDYIRKDSIPCWGCKLK